MIRYPSPFLSALALALALTSLPAAADDRARRLELAGRYVAETLEVLDLEAMVRTMYRPVLDQFAATGRRVSDDQIARLDALYLSIMLQPLRAIMAEQDEIMADLFTLEEIEALYGFFSTPVGRSVLTKMPQLTERIQPHIMAMIEENVPLLLPQVIAILEGR